MVLVTQSRKQEVLVTIVLPCAIAWTIGICIEAAVRARLLIPLLAQGPDVIASHGIVYIVVGIALILFAWLQFRWSYRLRYGLLGAAMVGLGLAAPASIGIFYEFSPVDVFDISGFMFICFPMLALSLLLTVVIYGVRLVFMGRSVEWDHTMCAECGYSLIGNVSGRCPECGEACDVAIVAEAAKRFARKVRADTLPG